MKRKVNYRKVEGEHGMFGAEFRTRRLSKLNHPLNKLSESIDFEVFRLILRKYCRYTGGAPWDEVLMFKIIILQRYYDLSEERTELEILSNLFFQLFLGLGLEDEVPDKNTIWLFKERLGEKGMGECFALFAKELEKVGLIGKGGKIVDASFVEVPKRHDKKGEKDTIKKGKTPRNWSAKKRAHKDTDARWAKKNAKSYFGYKNHIKVNRKSKLIEKSRVTPASVHDSQVVGELVDDDDTTLHADSAYRSADITQMLKNKGVKNYIHEKGKRGEPLNFLQKWSNHNKSKIRARVEHVFGMQRKAFITNNIRTIGVNRARRQITLANLLYNFTRYTFLCSQNSSQIQL